MTPEMLYALADARNVLTAVKAELAILERQVESDPEAKPDKATSDKLRGMADLA